MIHQKIRIVKVLEIKQGEELSDDNKIPNYRREQKISFQDKRKSLSF